MDHERDDMERLLQRYRPSAPPASLRNRVVAGNGGAQPPSASRLTWLAIAAALIMAVAMHIQASRTFKALTAPAVERAAAQRAAAIDDMTAAFGGGDRARREVERWLEASPLIVITPIASRVDLEALWTQ